MKKINKIILGCVCATALLACKETKKSLHDNVGTDKALTSESVIDDMVDIDEIGTIEGVIADSSYMEAKGDTAWRRINDQMIRVRIGKNCYLRKETKDANVTSLTYKYD